MPTKNHRIESENPSGSQMRFAGVNYQLSAIEGLAIPAGVHDTITAKGQIISSLVAFHDAVFIYNEELTCTSCGYNKNKELPSHFKNVIGDCLEKIVQEIDKDLLNDLKTGKKSAKFQCEQQLDIASGRKYLKHSFSHILLPGEKTALVHCIDDISVEKNAAFSKENEIAQLRRALKDFAEIVENATEMIFKVDRAGHFTFISEEFQRALGHDVDKMVGKHFSEIVHPEDLPEIAEVFAYIVEFGKTTLNRVFRVLHADGGYRWVSCSALFLFDENNVTSHGIGFAQDVTDLQEAVNTLKATEQRYAAFIKHSTEAIWRFEADKPLPVTMPCDEMIEYIGKHAYLAECNDKMAEYHGFGDASELLGCPLSRIFDVSDQRNYKFYTDFINNGFRLTNFESFEVDKHGNKSYFLNNLVGIVEDGMLLRVWGTHRNITRQREAEEKLRNLAQAMQNVSDVIISTDLNFNILAWNKAAEQVYEIEADVVLGKPIRQFVHHEYVNCTREDVVVQLEETDFWEGLVYFDRNDGRRIYLTMSLSCVKNDAGEKIGFVGIHKDITDRREADEALRISEERYRSVVNALREGIVLLDKTGAIIAHNSGIEKIFSFCTDQIKSYPNISGIEYYYEDGREFPLSEHPAFATLKKGKSMQNVVIGVKRADGSFRWVSVNTEPVYYSNDRQSPDGVVASIVDITEAKAAKLALEQNEKQLREYVDHVGNILDSITDGFIAIDKDSNILLWNRVIEKVTGITTEQAIGKNIYDIFPILQNTPLRIKYEQVLKTNKPFVSEHYSEQYKLWFETSAYPSAHGLFIYFRDITARKSQEKILSLEKEVLEINTHPGASLNATVNYFLERLENIFPGMKCSVMELKEDEKRMYCLAAPNLPNGFMSEVDGALVSKTPGPCSTVIRSRQALISSDIYADPLWEDYVWLARAYDLRSCWLFPILNTANEVTATIAAYHNEPKTPSEQQYSLLERNSKLLGLIIENKKAEARIKISNERYLIATKATNDALWDLDLQNNNLFWGEGFSAITGYQLSELNDPFELWKRCVHPEDLPSVLNSLTSHIQNANKNIWETEYRFQSASGKYLLINDRGYLVFNSEGKPIRMVGSFQDITEKHEMQKKLVKQEVEKQKLIAKAVVEAQEKERAEIGKELHDNVNQILSTARLYLEVAKNDEKARLDLIKRSADNIFDAVKEIRSISRSLVPPSLNDLGLIESIEDLVENVRLTRKLNVAFYYSQEVDRHTNQQQKLMLFRIIQEQVNNVLKHAEASKLTIELSAEESSINLSISDDGKGFDPNNIKNKKGVGLSNIKSRAELFNGTVNMVTAPGEGCILLINVPF